MCDSENGKKTYWFKAGKHKYSWGLPLVWQGWITLVLLIFGIYISIKFILPISLFIFVAFSAFIAIAMFIVCLVKGEPTSD